jgi:hypothetical protein
MPASLIDAESLLAVDVGSVTTQATLFDVVDGCYRFIAAGRAPTTATAPLRDISHGVIEAIQSLQSITGRTFLSNDRQLIVPVQEGAGVGSFAATLSAGPAIKTVVVGLLDDVSMESVQRLARSTYTRVVETISLNDARKPEEQIDSIVRLTPELILMAGGTDRGATRSVEKILEVVGLACFLLPADKHPAVLYAGNQNLAEQVKTALQPLTSALTISPNIRPALESEDLQPAQNALSGLVTHIRSAQMSGVDDLNKWAGGTLMPTASARGRIVRFLSEVYGKKKGILSVDIGASCATIAAGFGGEMTLGVYPQLGLGEGLVNLLRYTNLEDIQRWVLLDIAPEAVRDYLYQKSIYPATLPAVIEDLAIEQALARQNLLLAVKAAMRDFPAGIPRPAAGLLPSFEPILAGGSPITHAPTLGQALLILLDGIQPTGITTIILDQNNLLPGLGAAASRSSILPVQVLESGAFQGLATVVSPVADVKYGTPILRARLVDENGNQSKADIKMGALEILPLASGQSGTLYLEPLHRTDFGLGPGRSRKEGIPVNGTMVGVVIDGRGRPLRLPADPAHRRELLKKWLWTVGG